MPWVDNDLTAIAGGPQVFSNLLGYTTSIGGEGPCARVAYRSVGLGRHVHELSLVSGRTWADNDLTAIAGGPQAFSSPVGYTTGLDGQGPCARVVYVSPNRHVHELSLRA